MSASTGRRVIQRKVFRTRKERPQYTVAVGEIPEEDVQGLLQDIRNNNCVPILGPGVCAAIRPSLTEIAARITADKHLPKAGATDLARAAQYLVLKLGNSLAAKQTLTMELRKQIEVPAALDAESRPHVVLARLPVPLYLTTNYDNFLLEALRALNRDARRDYCRWFEATSATATNYAVESQADGPNAPGYLPDDTVSVNIARPLVYHLHGYAAKPESLVVSENDYLDFVRVTNSRADAIAPGVHQVLRDRSILLLGYHLGDWDFRVLIRSLLYPIKQAQGNAVRRHFVVQLPLAARDNPGGGLEILEAWLRHNYFDLQVTVVFAEVETFLQTLINAAEADQDPETRIQLWR